MVLVVALIGLTGLSEPVQTDFTAVHTEAITRLQTKLRTLIISSFAVVGNINNSVGVFERTF